MARLHPHIKKIEQFEFRHLTSHDTDELNQMIYDWSDDNSEMLASADVECSWNVFYEFFMKEVMRHSSILRTVRPCNFTRKPKPALTKREIESELDDLIKGPGDNLANAANFLSGLFDESERDIQHIISTHSQHSIRNPHEIAEYANKYLVSVMNPPIEAVRKNRPNTYRKFNLTRQMVLETLQNPKPTSLHTTGVALITAEMLQITAEASSEVLYQIFKRSLRTEQLPDDWRHTLITLKHKDGERTAIENYRPIGITCAPSKVTFPISLK